MRRVAVIHFNPLELYPPVQNFLNHLEKTGSNCKVYVFTTHTIFKTLQPFTVASPHIKIFRLGTSGKTMHAAKRYFNYVLFFLGSLVQLIFKRPSRVLYFETISSYPAYLYKRYFNTGIEVLIHFHEYTSPGEYASGMKLVKYFFQKEKTLYPKASWISHTNQYRMDKFIADMSPTVISNKYIIPNYPPKSWYHPVHERIEMPVRVVFAGSLGMETMYTREFATWVMEQRGKVIWDVYSYIISPDAKDFIGSLHSEFICFKQGVNYNELPGILKNYHVGVILYKGHNDNYIYNAPNKLFEYLDCGLDVWFPNQMQGTTSYITGNTYPKVVPLDFMHLNQLLPEQAVSRAGYSIKQDGYFCEDVLGPLCKKLTHD